MKWSLHGAAIIWPDGKEIEHTIRMNLDLSVKDFLVSTDVQSIGPEIAQIGSDIYRRLRKVFVREVVPQILELKNQDVHVPREIGYAYSDECKNIPFIDDSDLAQRGLIIRNQLRLLLNIHTSRPFTSVQATYLGRAHIASTLASTVMAELKNKYLGLN